MTGARSGRSVTVVVQRDGATTSHSYRIRLWILKFAAGVIIAALGASLLVAALYAPIVRAAARVPGLEREVARLRAENDKVRILSAALDSLEGRYAQVRQMMGADVGRDAVAPSSTLPVAPMIRARVGGLVGAEMEGRAAGPARQGSPEPGLPVQWPLDESGYITRGQIDTGARDEAHPGTDIAVSVGDLVRASGAASVRQVGDDPEYGLFVLLDHSDEYQTMYGHLSRIVVTVGQTVAQGEVIGLSGNTGRSTAPHLHFEVRQRGLSLDPLTIVKERR